MKKKIRLFKPAVGKPELNAIKRVFKNSWLGYGNEVKKFEKEWEKYFNIKHAVAVNSCTAALHTCLAVNNFKRNKKVLVPSITFSATAASVLYCGLIPVFVDINPNNLNISFDDLKKKYSKDCVAIMIVHFGGEPCEMDKIMPWAKQKKLVVIEDCAETCGGTFKGKKLGTWGDYGCFSFEEKKIMTTGDGGMICTNKTKMLKNLQSFSFHGWDKDPYLRFKKSLSNKKNYHHWDYDIKNIGYKYNMNDLTASIGREQLKKIKWLNSTRKILIKTYLENIKDLKNIRPSFGYNLKDSSYWMMSIRCKKRDKLIDFLKSKKISTSVHLKPLTELKVYKKYKSEVPNALKIWPELVTLPLYPELKLSEVRFILKKLFEFDKNYEKY